VVVVGFFAATREVLSFSLSEAGDVEVLRGDAAWFDFDMALAAEDGRQLTRSEPLEWALALQASYEGDSQLSVWVSVGRGDPPAAVGLGGSPTAGHPMVPARTRGLPRLRPRWRARRGRSAIGAVLACVLLAGVGAGVLVPGLSPHKLLTNLRSLVGATAGNGCNGSGCANTARAPKPAPPPAVATAASRGIAELASADSTSPVSRDPSSGLWGDRTKPAWWQSALALGTLVRYLLATHNTDPHYQQVLVSTYNLNVRKPGTHMPLNFGNQFLDDSGWWGLTWLDAARYEAQVRHDYALAAKFLYVAEWDANYIYTRRRTCGGGLAWRLGKPPDTITGAEFVTLAAQLYGLRHGPGYFHDDAKASLWLADAVSSLNWMENSGLIDVRKGVVIDTFDNSCHLAGGALTYTQGQVADALTQMGAALKEPSYFRQANAFLGYTMNPRNGMMHNGVLQEYCESRPAQCKSIEDFNVSVFKGMFVQAVSDYEQATGDTRYMPFLRAQAQAIVRNSATNAQGARTSCQTPRDCQFGFYWARAIDPAKAPVGVTVATQISALRALTAELAS
jgi:hypothetical protein